MRLETDATKFFNGFAEAFDTIYDEKRNVFMRWVDCQFRSDMFLRFTLTFERLSDLTGKTVLDIGCGSGPYVEEVLKRGAKLVTAVDPAPNMLALLQERLKKIGLQKQCASVHGLFPGANLNPHDHVIVMGVMDYVSDAKAFLENLVPLVHQSAVLSFPSRHWLRTPFRKFRYRLRNCPVYFYNEQQIRELCVNAGFGTVKVEKLPGSGMDYHVWVKP